ncbi:hypothetical protein FBY30_2785 [Arthrobacter sp. SLBN-83]|uniref:hypothetical protein n=1 Tax=Arthrobacter sp. SLBN-83 TaxID=2768449 RepID=UPI001174025F|nr:hypothetical protein [Arthrobacter sp. SLBN-83]TQJ60517.1 hypothetical protein FBY30_2785 [Arthrobacter sp. SLBN-83]
MTETNTGLARLRDPFPPNAINLLPKQVRRDDKNRFQCNPQNGRQVSMDGKYCGGYHALSIHLDYVGHAALTDRLLEVDPEWSWEPLAIGENGLPVFDKDGGLWIRLKICGVERLGYGDSQGKTGGNAVKEAIGDALRNAGMRFGAALDLWHKGDLHDASEEQGKLDAPAEEPAPAPARKLQRKTVDLDIWVDKIADCGTKAELQALWKTAQAEGQPEAVLSMIVQAAGERAA